MGIRATNDLAEAAESSCNFHGSPSSSALRKTMNRDTDKVVDLCRYRERQTRAREQPFAHPRAAPAHPLFLLVSFPVLVPVPIIWLPYWTMLR